MQLNFALLNFPCFGYSWGAFGISPMVSLEINATTNTKVAKVSCVGGV